MKRMNGSELIGTGTHIGSCHFVLLSCPTADVKGKRRESDEGAAEAKLVFLRSSTSYGHVPTCNHNKFIL